MKFNLLAIYRKIMLYGNTRVVISDSFYNIASDCLTAGFKIHITVILWLHVYIFLANKILDN